MEEQTMKCITVLLAEDHAIFREGVRALLATDGDIEVVGEAPNGREAVDLARKLHPDIVIMDISMPVLNGCEATRQVRMALPQTKVVALSAHSDDAYVAQMRAAGASGYVVKQDTGHALFGAIKKIAGGHTYFSPTIRKRMADAERKAPMSGSAFGDSNRPLTMRETEVLQLVAEGAGNKQVASELGISIKTVEKHRQKLMDKLNIHHTAGLTRHAIVTGIIDVDSQMMTA
jgi:DNA-binding NarL/FixJ family response regulator